MDFLKALDIAIGLIVIYLTFALGVTAFNEAVATWLSSRAKWLRRGVSALLGDQAKVSVTAEDVFKSPFIKYLTESSSRWWRPGFEPSYLSAQALLKGTLDAVSKGQGKAISTVKDIESAAAHLPADSPIKAVVLDLVGRADDRIEVFEKLFEAWFKTFEQQVGAWYRQKTQNVIFGLSLLVVLAMNVDTLAMLQQLSVDAKLRAALVEQAVRTAQTDPIASPERKALDDARTKLEQAGEKPDAERAAAVAQAASGVYAAQQALETAAVARIDALTAAGVRLGWGGVAVEKMGWQDWATKAIGLFLSAAALSLGAPFWFDLLKRVMAVRSVGMTPDEHEAKDAKAKAP